jgi:lysophospholipase L1-like esterase
MIFVEMAMIRKATAFLLAPGLLVNQLAARPARIVRPLPVTALWGYAQVAEDEVGESTLPPGTYRIPVRFGRAGVALRLTFANLDGNPPLALSAVKIESGGKTVAARFGGEAGYSIPRGQVATTDPIDINVGAGRTVVVTITTLTPWRPAKGHGGVVMTFAPTGGDAVEHLAVRPFLTLVAGEAPQHACTIVALGDSITDGDAGTTAVRGWPGRLADRFAALPPARRCSVVNMGIGGNRLLAGGRGQAALVRFDRDVLAVPGVTHLIYMEGINDLARSGDHGEPVLGVADILRGYRQIVSRAHQAGIRVTGGTITPFPPHVPDVATKDALRRAINDAIRAGGIFDAVIDFDAVLSDPGRPAHLTARLMVARDSGDHVHPSDAGYAAMADAIDLASFTTR